MQTKDRPTPPILASNKKGAGKTNLSRFEPSRKSKNLPKKNWKQENRGRPLFHTGWNRIVLRAIQHLIPNWWILCRVSTINRRVILSWKKLIIYLLEETHHLLILLGFILCRQYRTYGRWTDRGQTAFWSIFLLKIQGVDISSPIEFPCSFHTTVLWMTNRLN